MHDGVETLAVEVDFEEERQGSVQRRDDDQDHKSARLVQLRNAAVNSVGVVVVVCVYLVCVCVCVRARARMQISLLLETICMYTQILQFDP